MGLKEQKIGILPAEIRNLPVKIGIQLILANLVWPVRTLILPVNIRIWSQKPRDDLLKTWI